MMDLKKLKKLAKKLHIVGAGQSPDGRLLILVKEKSDVAFLQRHFPDAVIITEEVKLLQQEGESLEGEFFRSWCGGNCICSPPVFGITCHHCASPNRNESSVGKRGFLYNSHLEKVGETAIVEDRPFVRSNWFSTFAAYLCRIGMSHMCRFSNVNKYDYARVDYAPTVDGRPVGVIFAGADRGSVAISYDLFQVDASYESIKRYMRNRVYAYVTHCFSHGGRRHCPVVLREYIVGYEGFVNIYAYDSMFFFEPVYFLLPTDIPLTVECCDAKEYVTWAVQPGYSGGVVFTK